MKCIALVLLLANCLAAVELTDGRRWVDFGAEESWYPHSAEASKESSRKLSPSGLILSIPAHQGALRLGYTMTHREVARASGVASHLALELEVLAGSGLAAQVRLVDAENEMIDTQRRDLKPGLNQLMWKLDSELSQGWNGTAEKKPDHRLSGEFWIWEVVIHAAPSTTPVQVRLAGLDVTGEPMRHIAAVTMATAQPGGLLALGDPLPELVLRNAWKQEWTAPLHLLIEEYDGTRREETVQLKLPASGTVRQRLSPTLTGPRLGIRRLDWRLGDEQRGRERFALIVPPGRTPVRYDGFQFGMNGVNSRPHAQIAERMGITMSRFGWHWANVQPQRDTPLAQWNWNEVGQDDFMPALAEFNIAAHAIIGYNALWNAPQSAKDALKPGENNWGLVFTYPVDLDAYRTYVREFLRRYSGKLWSVSPWNEPGWFGDVANHPEWYPNDTYLKMQEIVFEEARKANPKLKVGSGGFACFNDPMKLQETVIREGQAHYDLHIAHEHGYFNYTRRAVGSITAWREKYGATDKPFLFDETAWRMVQNNMTDEVGIAEELARFTPFLWSQGAVGHCWFLMQDDGHLMNASQEEDDTRPGWERWGVLTQKNQPRAVAATFSVQVGLLRGKRFQETLPTDEASWAISFGKDPQKPGEQVVSRFCDPDNHPEQIYALSVAGGTAQHVDLMGNRVTLSSVDGVVPLPLQRQPGWTLLSGTDRPVAIAGRILRVAGTLIVDPGERVLFDVTNPTTKPVTVTLAFAGEPVRRELAPGETARLAVTAPPHLAGKPAQLMWAFPTLGAGWSGALMVPLSNARTLVNRIQDHREADFTAGATAEEVDNRFTVILGADEKRWQGPADASVAAYLYTETWALTLVADVRDDHHVQPYTGGEQWRGDGLQFALNRPGVAGQWVFGITRLADGTAYAVQWDVPEGRTGVQVRKTAESYPRDGGMRYVLRLSLDDLGYTREMLAAGFRANLICNDLDDPDEVKPLRESTVFVASGLHNGQNPSLWPLLRMAKEPAKEPAKGNK